MDAARQHDTLCDNISPVGAGMQASVPIGQLLSAPAPAELERRAEAQGSSHGAAAIKAADNADAYLAELNDLAGKFSKRNVLSALHPHEKGVHEARDYLRAELEKLGMKTKLQRFAVPRREFMGLEDQSGDPIESWNVIGCWEGVDGSSEASGEASATLERGAAETAEEVVYMIGAHYDAMPDAPVGTADGHTLEREEFGWHGRLPPGVHTAPGAMDDGSGVAAVLQTLRALAGQRGGGAQTVEAERDGGERRQRLQLRPTLYATLFSAEEQGYYGSMALVQAMSGVHPRELDPEGRDMGHVREVSIASRLERRKEEEEERQAPSLLAGGKARLGGALILDMTTDFKGEGSDGVPHPPCHLAAQQGACDSLMLDTQSRGATQHAAQANLDFLQELVGSARQHSKSAESVRVTTNPVSDYHTDATPFWRAGLPAVYGATKDHRIYQHWHGPHDEVSQLGGELGADTAVMATGWLAAHAASHADLERSHSAKRTPRCFSHFAEGSMQDGPQPWQQQERLSIDAALEKADFALASLQPA